MDWGSVRNIQEDIRPFFEVTEIGGETVVPENVYLRDNSMDLYHPSGKWRGSPGRLTEEWTTLAPDARGWFALAPTPRPEGKGRLLRVRVLRGGFARLYVQPWCRGARILRRGRAMRNIALARNGIDTFVLVKPGATDPTRREQRLAFQTDDVIEMESVPQWQDDAALRGQRSDSTTTPGPQVACAPARHTPRCVRHRPDRDRQRARPVGARAETERLVARSPSSPTSWPCPNWTSVSVWSTSCAARAPGTARSMRARSSRCCGASDTPARYVRGLWGGDDLRSRRSRVFRGKHYHAWVELHLDQVGWVPLNPTPPSRRPTDETADAHGDIEDDPAFQDPVEPGPTPEDGGLGPEALLQFGKSEQDELFSGLKEGARKMLAPLLATLRDPRVGLPLGVLGCLGLAINHLAASSTSAACERR